MMPDPHSLNVVVHVGAGALALLIGATPILSAKGGPLHRRFGRYFVWIGAVTLITAIIADILYDPPTALIAATVAFAYQYLSSLRALALKDRGPGWIDAAMALGGLGACALLFVFMGPGTPSWSPAIGYSTIGYVATVALYDLSRHAWASAWKKHARPLDHGLKMTGAYFAMMSAGIGNVFRDLQPWSQVGPSFVGLAVMAVLVLLYFAKRRPTAATE
jgi:hypothetical protein